MAAPRPRTAPNPAPLLRDDGSRGVELVTDNLETPAVDNRTYRVIRLANQLEALLVHDPDTDKASAAMDVNVGSFRDDPDMPGMAHAVEHLLFLGTSKFPEENEYGSYLSSNSGASNAYTAHTSTNYYFEVAAEPSNEQEPSATNPSPLLGALDRFAQFFIQPLFLASALDRELQAVDSENKKNLQSDTWRLSQIDKTLSNPRHPYSSFATGSLDVLKTEPEARGINVRDRFIEFYAKNYSANRMKLCVLGREPLDVLESWVVDLFSPVKNKNLDRNEWTGEVPFDKEHLGLQIFAKPVMDTRQLSLSFPFLDEEHLFESQPSRYIIHLLGHEGPGSVMSYVKSKGWVNSLGVGAYGICPGTPGIMEITAGLTKEGLQNYREVIKVIFQYIALLRETEPLQWIFDEQKGIADVDFKFREKTPAMRFTSKTSSIMQEPLPREWLLSGHSKLRKFDAGLIKQGLDCLRPDNLRLTLSARDYPGMWEKKEKWYGTEHTVEKIPDDLKKECEAAAATSAENRIAALHFPHRNLFVPTKLEVEKKEVKEPALAPRIVRNDELVRTWFKKDDTFWVPKANLFMSCRNPITYASAENAVKAHLFTELVQDALEEYSYDAELAGLEYVVTLGTSGLYLGVLGYNDKLAVLLEQVLIKIRHLEIRSDRFDIVKERIVRSYRNRELQSPFEQVGELMGYLLIPDDFLVEDLSAELPGITVDAVRQFHHELISHMHVELYVHGNVYKEVALKLTDLIMSTLKPRVLPRSQWPVRRAFLFPPGSNYLLKKTLKDEANVNHCIEYWLYIGSKQDQDIRAKTLLLDQILREPCFDQLRTKEQLGYLVFSGIKATVTTYGFRFVIQSEKAAPYLDNRIDAFLESMAGKLEQMSGTEFDGHKRSLIVSRLEKPKYLDQESYRQWNQITSEKFDFETAQLDAAQIKLLTKGEMVEFYRQYIDPASPLRAKVVVYMVAQAKSHVSTKQISDLFETVGLDDSEADVATNLQARLSKTKLDDDGGEIKALREYLRDELRVAEDKIGAATQAWKKMQAQRTGADVVKEGEAPPASNGTVPVMIEDMLTFKSGLVTSAGPQPARSLEEFEELESKL